MARPLEYDRQEILNKAMALFWRQGFAGTTLRDVLTETEFNRHSLYKEFGDMDGLFQAAIENYFQMSASLWTLLEGENAGLDSIRKIFEMRRGNDSKGLGCLASNAIINGAECGSEDAVALAVRYFKRVENGLATCIRWAQEKGEIRSEREPRALARYVLTVLHGLGPMGKSGVSKEALKQVAEITMESLQQ